MPQTSPPTTASAADGGVRDEVVLFSTPLLDDPATSWWQSTLAKPRSIADLGGEVATSAGTAVEEVDVRLLMPMSSPLPTL
uniref:Uncharacterized protein n=1 Tax=Leersia perrieri TaxID=77586 RepID=A0A0D9VWI9_9ORYZ